ncbi:uncharacterized protein V2V93DRAFT_362653 [Kockiozyma suomiensis]|uniref:uncharacterized protein n=1 Tax=Kockiozyma suomiensis TaxID=1337062 RepID=UPI0033431BC9
MDPISHFPVELFRKVLLNISYPEITRMREISKAWRTEIDYYLESDIKNAYAVLDFRQYKQRISVAKVLRLLILSRGYIRRIEFPACEYKDSSEAHSIRVILENLYMFNVIGYRQILDDLYDNKGERYCFQQIHATFIRSLRELCVPDPGYRMLLLPFLNHSISPLTVLKTCGYDFNSSLIDVDFWTHNSLNRSIRQKSFYCQFSNLVDLTLSLAEFNEFVSNLCGSNELHIPNLESLTFSSCYTSFSSTNEPELSKSQNCYMPRLKTMKLSYTPQYESQSLTFSVPMKSLFHMMNLSPALTHFECQNIKFVGSSSESTVSPATAFNDENPFTVSLLSTIVSYGQPPAFDVTSGYIKYFGFKELCIALEKIKEVEMRNCMIENCKFHRHSSVVSRASSYRLRMLNLVH